MPRGDDVDGVQFIGKAHDADVVRGVTAGFRDDGDNTVLKVGPTLVART